MEACLGKRYEGCCAYDTAWYRFLRHNPGMVFSLFKTFANEFHLEIKVSEGRKTLDSDEVMTQP